MSEEILGRGGGLKHICSPTRFLEIVCRAQHETHFAVFNFWKLGFGTTGKDNAPSNKHCLMRQHNTHKHTHLVACMEGPAIKCPRTTGGKRLNFLNSIISDITTVGTGKFL